MKDLVYLQWTLGNFSVLVSNSDQCELLLLNQEFACECKVLNLDESIIYSIIVQQ